MSTLQNRDNSCLAGKEQKRKMVVNGVKTLFKRHYKKVLQTESFQTVSFLRSQLRVLQGLSRQIKPLGKFIYLFMCVCMCIYKTHEPVKNP